MGRGGASRRSAAKVCRKLTVFSLGNEPQCGFGALPQRLAQLARLWS